MAKKSVTIGSGRPKYKARYEKTRRWLLVSLWVNTGLIGLSLLNLLPKPEGNLLWDTACLAVRWIFKA